MQIFPDLIPPIILAVKKRNLLVNIAEPAAKNITNVFSIDYENDGFIVGIAYMKSLELDWISILEKDIFKDYHKDRLRIYFELKGLGSLGRPKESYLKRRTL